MNHRVRILLLSVAVGLALIAGSGVAVYWNLRQPLRAKTTEARMVDLMGVLDEERPERLDPESLRPLLARYNRLECLEDAWGSPFVIERIQDDQRVVYTVISLGRDGRRGACCRKWTEDWDDDAVLFGKDWLQVWNPKAAQAR